MIHTLTGLGILALICSLPAIATAGTQQITPASTAVTAAPGESFEVTLNYSADSETLTGVGVQLYYDSSKLQLESISAIYAAGKLGVDSASKADSKNGDGDTSTDRVINAAWFDLGGRWPGVNATPLPLYTARFTAVDFTGSSAINLTGKPANRQDLSLGSVTVNGAGSGAGSGTAGGGGPNGDSGSGDSSGNDGSTDTDSGGGTSDQGDNGNGSGNDVDSNGSTGSDTNVGTDTDTDTSDGNSNPDGNSDSGDTGTTTNPNKGTQQLSLAAANLTLAPGDPLNITVNYTADSANLTGIGVQLHYDSSKLQLLEISSVFAAGKLAADSQSSPDTKNEDNEIHTDQKINAAWFDLGGRWPGDSVTQPLALYTAKFTAKEFSGASRINLSGRAASGQNLSLGSLTIAAKTGSNTGSGDSNPGSNGSNNSGDNSSDDAGSATGDSDNSGEANNNGGNATSDAGSDNTGTDVQGDSGANESTGKKKRGGSISLMTLLLFALAGIFSKLVLPNKSRKPAG